MIDIHSHLLPGIDDGPSSLDESIAMARYALQNGISHSVLTPHIHLGRYDNNSNIIAKVCREFQAALQENNIDLSIAFSAEVHIDIEIMAMIEKQQIPFLGKQDEYDLLLLEMPHSHILLGSENLIRWLLKRKIKPIIAHPERNKELQKNMKKAAELVQLGCDFQLTSASISGKFGQACQQAAMKMLDEGWVQYVATDAHNLKHRPPNLRDSWEILVQRYDQEQADNLCINNSWQIVSHQFESLC